MLRHGICMLQVTWGTTPLVLCVGCIRRCLFLTLGHQCESMGIHVGSFSFVIVPNWCIMQFPMFPLNMCLKDHGCMKSLPLDNFKQDKQEGASCKYEGCNRIPRFPLFFLCFSFPFSCLSLLFLCLSWAP